MIDSQRLRASLVAFAALLLTVPFIPQQLEAQQAGGRFQVLVADLHASDGSNRDFGRDVSEELRELIDLATHVAMDEDDIDDAADEYDMDWRDLDCNLSRQLAGQIEVPMVFCGTYAGGDMVEYSARFITIPAGEEFEVPAGQINRDDPEVAAQQIMDFFQVTTETVAQISYCGQDFNSQNWEGALQYCTRALELAPQSQEARSALAATYLQLEQYEESLEQYQALLEADPYNSNALESAGYVASQVGETELARDYYARYLELNPDNVQIRMRVAYDLAQTGDDLGAMTLLEDGIEQAPDNIDLHEQYGSMAARAALQLQEQVRQERAQSGESASAELDPEVAELFRKAVSSLTEVLEARGEESLPQYVMNTMGAHIQLNELDEAIALGERGLRYFPDNAQVRSTLANAYNRAGQLDQAIATLEEALEINPDLPNAYSRVGQWLLAAGRLDDAGEALNMAAERGEQPVDVLSDILFGHGYNTLHQNGEYREAIEAYNAARLDGISEAQSSKLSFFHGYALFQLGDQTQQAQTLESAQQSLPIFQEALTHLNRARVYGDANPGTNLDQFIDGTSQYIQIQEAIIERGR